MIQSLYGPMMKKQKEFKRIWTVGELKKVLEELPESLPINGDEGVTPMWYNIGKSGQGCNGEHLKFDDWPEDEDEPGEQE